MNILMRWFEKSRFLVPALVAGMAVVQAADAPRPLSIVTSFFPMYLHTVNVVAGIPGVTVRNRTRPTTGCLHDYQLTPEEVVSLAKADVLVVNGAGMESFLDKLVRQYPRLKVVNASAGIDLIKGADGEPNPHVWVSVGGSIQQVKAIAAGLGGADPARADAYRTNADAYAARLEALRQRMHAALKDVPQRRIITMHEAFPYFAREFDLQIAAVVEREPGSDPSARDLAETIGLIRKTGLKAIFAEPQYPAKAADAIARETGAAVSILDPCVTGAPAADTYLRIMEKNLDVLKAALK